MMGGEFRKIKKGEVVCREGEEQSVLFRMNKGKCKCYAPFADVKHPARPASASQPSTLSLPAPDSRATLSASSGAHHSILKRISRRTRSQSAEVPPSPDATTAAAVGTAGDTPNKRKSRLGRKRMTSSRDSAALTSSASHDAVPPSPVAASASTSNDGRGALLGVVAEASLIGEVEIYLFTIFEKKIIFF